MDLGGIAPVTVIARENNVTMSYLGRIQFITVYILYDIGGFISLFAVDEVYDGQAISAPI
jgi:hypothetical protein